MTDSLQQWCADARAGVEAQVRANPRSVNFADVMRRAHALDADTIGLDYLREADDLAPVLDIRGGAGVPDAGDAQLAAYVADVAKSIERTVAERRLAPVGPAPMPSRSVGMGVSGRMAGLVAAAVLVAAVVAGVAFIDVPGLMDARTDGRAEPEQALLLEEEADPTGAAVETVPRPRPDAADDAPPNEEPELELESEPEPEPARVVAERAPTRTSLEDLATLAEQHWRAGELGAATTTLSTIVRRGGSSRHAEMAYADLISIAAQQGDSAGRLKLWRRYLKKFPQGRFADDASAGLCRAAASSAQAGCWTAYLARFPAGSYRAEAARGALEHAP